MMLQQPSSGMRNSLANIIKNKIENDNDALDYLLPKGFSSDEHVMFLNKVPVPFNPIIPPRPPHISSTLSKETKMKNNHVTINTPYQSLERPKKISHIRFGMLTGKDIGKLSVLEVTNENLYENDSRNPVVNGCVDRRMGVSDKGSGLCGTCGQDIANCTGHFGHVTLVLPVYHPGFFKLTQNTLQSVCRECSRCLLHPETTEPKRDTILQTLQNPNCDAARREILRKKVLDAAKKITTCPWCSAPLGVVKKIAGATAVHLTHEIYKSRAFTGNDTKAIRMREIRRYQMRNAIANNPELKKIMERSSKKEAASSKEGASAAHCYTGPYQQETITPLDALWILSAIPDEDLPLIWSDPVYSRPESMIITSVIVPPVPIRPSVFSDRGTTEDDITVKVRDIVRANINLANALEDGVLAHVTLEKWNDLQTVISSMINSDLPGLAQSAAAKQQRSSRGLVQRLKGKQGRFRGNLSGKRVDFTGRTVISPDPNLEVTQVGVPLEMAMKLTYPEVVNRYNIEQLRQAVLNGPEIHPGANCIRKRGDSPSNAAGAAGSNAASGAGTPQGSLFAQRNDHLTFQSSVTGGTGPRNQPLPRPLPTSAGAKSGTLIMLGYIDRRIAAKNLKIGDVVERHIIDGDLVLFNRQPSLHKLSIMCHKAKVLPGRTLRFNECVCTPYNADFDGDEMNIHVPQTEEARTEALELMHVQYNLINPRNGEPLVAATQDFITGSYLMTSRGVFLTREQFCQAAFALDSRAEKIDIPPPTILKPVQLWTGKQLWSIVLKGIRPELPCVSFITKERLHKEPKFPSDIFTPDEKRTSKPQMIKEDPSFCENEGYVVFRNSELICGRIGKGTLGGGSKSSIIYVLVRDHSDRVAAQAMNRMTRMISRWISNHGFSFGIDDITPSQALTKIKITEIEKGEKECEEKIQKFKDGTLELRPGCNIEESLESEMSGILSRVRDTLGRICMDNLPYHNSPYTMASCGSKGSALNICQMVACVGQQIVNGKRMPDGFLRRSLPHFFMNSKEPKAKGFVRNSFYTGLEATEFFFHTMGGREGLVDTAVKTAETGYMQRRLMKALEDLAVRYDGTVRNSTEGIVQFMYGEDGLNPSCMESNDKLPIDFDRLLTHVQVLYPKKDIEAPEIDSRVMSSDELKKCCDEEFANIEPAVFGLWKGLIRIGEEKNNNDDSSSNKSVLSKLPLSGPEFFLSQIKKAMTSLIVKRKDLEDQLSQLSTIGQIEKDAILRNVNAITKRQFDEFVKLILRKYSKGISDPGEAVGAIGGQSLGEPGTQMTLKTFHFAGVASMNVTLGVPRIKEIINASKDISTPIITAYLADPTDKERASIIKARIERTSLGDICSFIEAVQYPQDYRINIKLDFDLMRYFHLEYITIHDVVKAIKTSSKIKSMFPAKDEKPVYTWGKLGITISISTPKTKKEDAGKKLKKKKRTFLLRKQKPKSLLSSSFLKKGKKNKRDDDDDDEWNGGEDEMDEDENDDDDAMDEDNEDDNDPLGMRSRLGPIDPDKNLFFQAQDLLDLLSDVIVAGIPTVNRAVINEMEKKSPEDPSKYQILVEGAGLLAVLGQEGIDHRKTRTNHAMEIEKVLGIEAVRQIIIDEVNYIFKQYGIGIDSRHLKLLADVMTYRGQVLGITRFGMSKMKESFLMLASFEKTADHLFDAAVHGREDEIRGISECIIMGAPLPIGTGAFKLVGEVSKDTRENGIWWQDTLFDEEVASLLSELSISQNGGSSNPFIEERLTN